MLIPRIRPLVAALALTALVTLPAQAQTEVQWWHSMGHICRRR